MAKNKGIYRLFRTKEERDYELDYLGELPGVLLQQPAEEGER